MSRRVLFYVQHLLGIGHLRRAATLARALAAGGLEVTLVSGGHEIPGLALPGVELVQLPPTRATDLSFKLLVDAEGQPVDEAWKSDRRERLLAVWRQRRPHVLMFELFPFGRRQMRFELLALLEAADAAPRRPAIVCSVRDILVGQAKPEREEEMVALVRRWFDRVLVHGDPALIPFERTFPLARRIADRLAYTGYVVDESGLGAAPDGPGSGEVLVSAGGGAVGERLLAAAIAARPLTPLAGLPWRVLVGVAVPAERFDALAAAAPPGVLVERARPDFPAMLARCRLSISQGGYNTMMESLQAGCAAVAIPYAGGSETEQTLRVRLLADRGLVEMLDEAELTPASLAAAGPRPASRRTAPGAGIDTGGAATAARMIRDLAEALPWS